MTYELAKHCKDCKEPFKANSNVQVYCKPCKAKRRKEKSKVYNHDYYMKNQENKLEGYKAYNKSERGRASQKLRDAIRQGKIERQPCEICKEPNAEGHHFDYSKPLEVKWLCRTHHAQHHLYKDWQVELINAGYKSKFDLASLIEACGEEITLSTSLPFDYKWVATNEDPESCYYKNIEKITAGYGSTPEEAVASLWISLNKNKND